jgi:hypothetical protein
VTLLGRLVTLFPAAHLAAIAAGVLAFALHPAAWTLALVPAAVYLLPLLAFRTHELFLPLETGRVDLSAPAPSAWWSSYHFQSLFLAAPALEGLLRLVPGLYSAWLRGWGSRIGRGVFWPPSLDVLDRGALVVGDGVIIGHEVKLLGHYVRKLPDGRPELYYDRLEIGAGVLIGAGSRLGPGCRVGARARLDMLVDVYPGQHVPDAAHVAERTQVRGTHAMTCASR